jgi:hypothetical protein
MLLVYAQRGIPDGFLDVTRKKHSIAGVAQRHAIQDRLVAVSPEQNNL